MRVLSSAVWSLLALAPTHSPLRVPRVSSQDGPCTRVREANRAGGTARSAGVRNGASSKGATRVTHRRATVAVVDSGVQATPVVCVAERLRAQNPASTWHGCRRLAESIASLASLPHACYLPPPAHTAWACASGWPASGGATCRSTGSLLQIAAALETGATWRWWATTTRCPVRGAQHAAASWGVPRRRLCVCVAGD